MRRAFVLTVTLALVVIGLLGVGPHRELPREVSAHPPELALTPIGEGGRRLSYATRHVPSREEAAMTGALHPATDRVMVLLTGWVLLALTGGGLFGGVRRGPALPCRPTAGTPRPERTPTGS